MKYINSTTPERASQSIPSNNEVLLNYYTNDVIVVGAGISGLTVANELNASGVDVCVFEKSRGTGGRIGSKRVAIDSNPLESGEESADASFDLGASVFQAKSTEFKHFVDQLIQLGVVSKVNDASEDEHDAENYVAVPRNSMLTRHMSSNLNVTFSKKISKIELKDAKWYLFAQSQTDDRQPQTPQSSASEEIIACCRHLVLSVPAEQASALLPPEHAALSWLHNIHSDPVFVSSLIIKPNSISNEQLKMIEHFSNQVIDKISIEHMKAQRNQNGYQIIKLTTTVEWSLKNLDKDLSFIGDELAQVFNQLRSTVCANEIDIIKQYTHRWLYSQYSQLIKSTKGYLSFADNLHLVGDYFDVNHRTNTGQDQNIKGVERAYLSGKRLVNHLVESDSFNQQSEINTQAQSL
jgi:predicted NAD/FAD-dependent oxidoreductase